MTHSFYSNGVPSDFSILHFGQSRPASGNIGELNPTEYKS